MSDNPLIGKQISLISKKNIRYLGTLYSINEQNATVALQNVRSFGTEGRPGTAVAASSDVHPFLVFRGQDITDLHVHEEGNAERGADSAAEPAATPAPPAATAEKSPAPAPVTPQVAPAANAAPSTTKNKSSNSNHKGGKENDPKPGRGGRGRGGGGRRGNRAAPGTGASLLNRPTRGAVAPNTESLKEDFDFQSNLKEFQDENDAAAAGPGDEDEDEAGDEQPHVTYEKDDFFDSISCEATDRQSGVDNRLRGREERDLNTETFGAVALSQRRRRGGRGGRGGRGRGRGRGRGGRGGRGRGRGGYHHRRDEGMPRAQSS